MTKYFCDWCEKEIQDSVWVEINPGWDGKRTFTYLCKDCGKKVSNFINSKGQTCTRKLFW